MLVFLTSAVAVAVPGAEGKGGAGGPVPLTAPPSKQQNTALDGHSLFTLVAGYL